MKGNWGANKLARTMRKIVDQRSNRPEVIELGIIQNDMSLLPDHYRVPIPQGEYLISRTLNIQNPMGTTTEVQDHQHDIPRPDELAPLAPGDRVLIVWANDSTDPIIIDVVQTS